jgi:hypothetical protein
MRRTMRRTRNEARRMTQGGDRVSNHSAPRAAPFGTHHRPTDPRMPGPTRMCRRTRYAPPPRPRGRLAAGLPASVEEPPRLLRDSGKQPGAAAPPRGLGGTGTPGASRPRLADGEPGAPFPFAGRPERSGLFRFHGSGLCAVDAAFHHLCAGKGSRTAVGGEQTVEEPPGLLRDSGEQPWSTAPPGDRSVSKRVPPYPLRTAAASARTLGRVPSSECISDRSSAPRPRGSPAQDGSGTPIPCSFARR